MCLQSPRISRDSISYRGVRGPIPLLLGREFGVALRATSSEMSGTFTPITNRKCGGTITIPMGPTTVRTLGGAVRCWLGACRGCCRRRLLLLWVLLSVPGATFNSSASSSWWSSTSSSSAVALTRVVLIVPSLVWSRASCHSRHGARSVVGGMRRMSAVLLHGSYLGHVRT